MDEQLTLPIGVGSAQQFEPWGVAQEGARRFTKGAYKPPAPDLQVNPRVGQVIQREYRQKQDQPTSEHTRRSYDAMVKETAAQHRFMTQDLGIKHEVVSHDPYATPHDLYEDVSKNHRIKTLATATTGSHNYMSDEANDQFRAVHDFFGHVATGRGFSRHGEEAAYQSHVQMYSPSAREAMSSETRGQNSYLNYGPSGEFPDQGSSLVGMSRFAQAPNAGDIERGIPDRVSPASNAEQLHLPRIR